MDDELVFLNGILEKAVYTEQTEGFANLEVKNMVYRLQRALYGLKGDPRAWYKRLHSYITKIRLTLKNYKSNVYLKVESEEKLN